ncbi:MAG TPA: hypothetical protein VHT26_11615, partial [Trebonia sp.]|nr:hypothetical protein [Trebonia sp.]
MKLSAWHTVAVASAISMGLLAACSSGPAGPHTATLAADGSLAATLHVLTGTAVLTIGTANFGLGGALLRVSTPAGDPPPQLRTARANAGTGTLVELSAKGAAAVTVTLNTAVGWRLDLGGGTTRTVADLRGAQVAGISFTAGSDVIDLALPRPHGSVPVQLAAGTSQFLLSLPGGVPARVTAAAGAGEVSLEGQDHAGVAGGSVFTTPGWEPGAPGFDIDATAGAARVTVTTRA